MAIVLSNDPKYGFQINLIYGEMQGKKGRLDSVPEYAVLVKGVRSSNNESYWELPRAPKDYGYLAFPYGNAQPPVPVPLYTKLKKQIKELESKIKVLMDRAAAEQKKEKDKEKAIAAEAAILARREEARKKLSTDYSKLGCRGVFDTPACVAITNAVEADRRARIRDGDNVTVEELEREKNKSNAPVRRQPAPRPSQAPKKKPIPKARGRR